MAGLNSRMERLEDRTRELEERTIKIIQSEQWRKNRLKNMNRVSRNCGTITKDLTSGSLESSEE